MQQSQTLGIGAFRLHLSQRWRTIIFRTKKNPFEVHVNRYQPPPAIWVTTGTGCLAPFQVLESFFNVFIVTNLDWVYLATWVQMRVMRLWRFSVLRFSARHIMFELVDVELYSNKQVTGVLSALYFSCISHLLMLLLGSLSCQCFPTLWHRSLHFQVHILL